MGGRRCCRIESLDVASDRVTRDRDYPVRTPRTSSPARSIRSIKVGKKKEVQITPLSITFRTLNPPNFKSAHLTPLSLQYQVIYPLTPVRAVLAPGFDDVERSSYDGPAQVEKMDAMTYVCSM
jgi:hypothetical protein